MATDPTLSSRISKIKDPELHRIALTAIIYKDDGTYLITRRSLSKKAFPGMWTVPGGGLTIDDYIHEKPTTSDGQWYHSLAESLRREVKEEVNLKVGKLEYLLDLTFIRPDGIPVLVLSYFAPFLSGEVIHDDETIDSAWVSLKEAKKYDLIEGVWEEIEMVEKLLKERNKGKANKVQQTKRKIAKR